MQASVDIFVLFYLVLIVMSINLNLKGLMFLRTFSVHDLNIYLNHLTKIHNFSCRPIRKRVYTRLSNLIVQLMRLFVRFRQVVRVNY